MSFEILKMSALAVLVTTSIALLPSAGGQGASLDAGSELGVASEEPPITANRIQISPLEPATSSSEPHEVVGFKGQAARKAIIMKMRQVEVLVVQGMTRVEAFRQIGISEQTYDRWKKRLLKGESVSVS